MGIQRGKAGVVSDLARKLVEHPRWEWHVGMVDGLGEAIETEYDADRMREVDLLGGGLLRSELPDIDHPATKGWLLAMLRVVYKNAFAQETSCGWLVFSGMSGHAIDYDGSPTEGEALARALLAAWEAAP